MLYELGADQSLVLCPVKTTMLLEISAELVKENKSVRPTVRTANRIVYRMVSMLLTKPMILCHSPIASLNSATPLQF